MQSSVSLLLLLLGFFVAFIVYSVERTGNEIRCFNIGDGVLTWSAS